MGQTIDSQFLSLESVGFCQFVGDCFFYSEVIEFFGIVEIILCYFVFAQSMNLAISWAHIPH